MSLPYLFAKESSYFGFFPLAFVDKLVEAANEHVQGSIGKFLNVLHGSHEIAQIPTYKLEEGILKALTLMESAVDINFDIFELYVLRNIFRFTTLDPSIPTELPVRDTQYMAGFLIYLERREKLLEKLLDRIEVLQSKVDQCSYSEFSKQLEDFQKCFLNINMLSREMDSIPIPQLNETLEESEIDIHVLKQF